MVVAVGRIMNTNRLIGLRIFDTETKQTKDIRIEDSKKLEIKNINNINKLGVVDNKQEDKPLLVLGYKDKKYLTVDINGNTKILESISNYNTVDLLTNIEQYKKYQIKQSLIGNIFEFDIREDTDEVILTKYIEDNQDYRVIEIPTFVTSIKIEEDSDGFLSYSPFKGIYQNLKVIYKGNKIKSMRGLFNEYSGEKLDLSNFDTSKVTNMECMFNYCEKLTSLDVSNFDTSKVTNMECMFNYCEKLTSLDVSNFDTSNVTNMSCMFYSCKKLKELDLSNFDTSKVIYMRGMFNHTKLKLKNINTI